jgi:AcrR family transcriptional regulator
VTDRPYHHGNLRAELLAAAEQMLREQGPGGISLRELARQTGVTHNAPNRHFRDRQALLEALAVEGFGRLGRSIDSAIADAGSEFTSQLRAAAMVFVLFATDDPVLLDLMLSLAKSDDAPEARRASSRVYAAIGELIRHGQEKGELRPGDPDRHRILITATLQGIASLASTLRIPRAQIDELIDDAVMLFIERDRDAK